MDFWQRREAEDSYLESQMDSVLTQMTDPLVLSINTVII